MRTQFCSQMHFYFKLFSLVNSNANNSVQYQYSFYSHTNVKTVLFQTVQFSVSTVSLSKRVLFPKIQFSMSTQFSSILPGSGPWSDGKEVVLHVPQSSSITGTSPSDC